MCVCIALNNPRLVCYSPEILFSILGLHSSTPTRADFPAYMCGNLLLKGSRTAAHCYAGHQFGHFSGQLGDGATMYLGELDTPHGHIEIQYKGAGLTPYSRRGDGRKVLRSSLREMLMSEHMHALGIPTTRAGTLVTSDSTVIRDLFYDGNAIREQASVITRLAGSFIRFGSFEIANEQDPITGMSGPSVGVQGITATLLEYVLKNFYTDIWNTQRSLQDKAALFFVLV